MVQIYRRKWQRGFLSSLLGYLRDALVLYLPVRRLHPRMVRLLYGSYVEFAFLVHPRVYQDVFISAPFLKVLKFLFRRNRAYGFVSEMLPFVLNSVDSRQGVNGFVIAQLTLPEIMFDRRKETLEMLRKALILVSKICRPGAIVGLGGWFPMVTRRGVSLEGFAESLGLIVTNGHCGTLASIHMMVEKIAEIAHIPLEEMTLAVLGAGKMGANVARVFSRTLKRLVLIDIDRGNLDKIRDELTSGNSRAELAVVLFSSDQRQAVRHALRESVMGVCATGSFRNVLKVKDMPRGFVAIDDSRPEALPRDPKNERIVLEGGLLKIEGARIDYDYGFGHSDNAFGCLVEAFILALDKQKTLKPTLGDVEMDNFFRFLAFCRSNGVTVGDFKSSETLISDAEIEQCLAIRKAKINQPAKWSHEASSS